MASRLPRYIHRNEVEGANDRYVVSSGLQVRIRGIGTARVPLTIKGKRVTTVREAMERALLLRNALLRNALRSPLFNSEQKARFRKALIQ